ncbi:hypothetical protein BD289DRAFT_421159 [Coniella lustricola]|uniref:Uncharacterized protein n=1 Tax=Coniella lustricola TaxID=2025994 RepID=A0A2T3AM13_9PEZI|nr:hypothetical protein BD289DRAFT_421159 [Coniella lustricola]
MASARACCAVWLSLAPGPPALHPNDTIDRAQFAKTRWGSLFPSECTPRHTVCHCRDWLVVYLKQSQQEVFPSCGRGPACDSNHCPKIDAQEECTVLQDQRLGPSGLC